MAHREPVLELVVVGRPLDLLREQPPRRLVAPFAQRRLAFVKVAERRVRFEPRHPLRQGLGLGGAAEVTQHRHAVRQRVQVVGLAVGHAAQRRVGQIGAAGLAVDDAERQVGAGQLGVGADRLTRPAVGVARPLPHQRLDRAVVQEHRDDGALVDRAGSQAVRVARRHEVDHHRRRARDDEPARFARRLEHEVDVADRDVEAVRAVPGVVADDGLVAHRQAELLRECGGHQHQRQAVAGARVEGLGRGARAGGVVLEAQVAAVERVDQQLAAVAAGAAVREPRREVGAHRRAQRERRGAVDRRRGGLEHAVVEQAFDRRHRRRAGARGEQQRGQQGSQGLHRASSVGPTVRRACRRSTAAARWRILAPAAALAAAGKPAPCARKRLIFGPRCRGCVTLGLTRFGAAL